MKAMLIAIFRAMQRKKLGSPEVKTSANSFRTNNVVQMDRRTGGTATGRISSSQSVRSATPKPLYVAGKNLTEVEQRIMERMAAENYELAKKCCESAWVQPKTEENK